MTVEAPKELLKAQRLANLLDTAVRIPIVNIRVGLDFLLGVFPIVGDAIAVFIALRIIWLGKKMQMPRPLLTTMMRNSLLDFVLGLLPVLGDVVDIFYKSNQKNVRIMERWWVENHKAEIDLARQQAVASWRDSEQV